MKRAAALAAPLLALLASAARAQDFGREWMDRVTHRLEEERAPFNPAPADLRFFLGERFYSDSNVYLAEHGRDGDSVFVTYGNARLDYVEEDFDAALDLQANYNYYVHEDDARDDEERLFGRARWASPGIQVELAEIFRRESDPFVDPQVVERVERVVSDTCPRASLAVTDVFWVEANADVQFVRFSDDRFEGMDNLNVRVGLLGDCELSSGLHLLLDGGWLSIQYRNAPTDADHPGPPDAQGGYLRGGFRGDVQQRIFLSVLAGATRAASEAEGSLGIEGRRLVTADVEMHLRVEGSERATIFADYVRRIAFGAGESFEVINRAVAGIEYSADEKLKLTGRVQYDYVHGIGGVNRDYGSVSLGAAYLLEEDLLVDVGVTYRRGGLDPAGDFEFTDVIFSAGLAFLF